MRKIKFSHEYERVLGGKEGKVEIELFVCHELKRLFIKFFILLPRPNRLAPIPRGRRRQQSLLYHLILEIYAMRSCYVYLRVNHKIFSEFS